MGGAVLTETVFAWPGLGRLMVKAIFARDYVLLQGAVLVFALAFVVINLLVDLAYGAARPARRASGLSGDGQRSCTLARRPWPPRDSALMPGGASAAIAWRWSGSLIVALLVVAALAAPWLAPYDPAKQSLIEKRARPGGKYLLGADEFGRDILSRVIYGSARGAAGGRAVRDDRARPAGSCSACLAGFARRLARRADHARRSRCCWPFRICCSPSRSSPRSVPACSTPRIAVGIWGMPDGHPHRARRRARRCARRSTSAPRARSARPRAARADAPRAAEHPPRADRLRDALHGQRHPASRPRCPSSGSGVQPPTAVVGTHGLDRPRRPAGGAARGHRAGPGHHDRRARRSTWSATASATRSTRDCAGASNLSKYRGAPRLRRGVPSRPGGLGGPGEAPHETKSRAA